MKRKTVAIILAAALLISMTGPVAVRAESISDVADYSYEVTPVLSPFAYYLYVKTDNPDPFSFRLVDEDSRFFGSDDHGEIRIDTDYGYSSVDVEPGTYYISRHLYEDVAYENADTWRVPGGYIFYAHGTFSDGGELALLQKTKSGSNILHDEFEKTGVTVSCESLNTREGYLIDTCTTEDMDLFEKLDAVQTYLNTVAVYPRNVYDTDTPNESHPYPLLAASPYPELSLNEHFSMYEPSEGGMLASEAYPFVLDSAGFPSTIRRVALQLEPECTVEWGSYHYLVDVTFGGETRSYGGAGTGGYDPLYSNRIGDVFTFRGTEDPASIGEFYDILRGYEAVAAEDAAKYRDLIMGETFVQTIKATGGTWIRCATEGGFDFGMSFAYIVPLGDDTWILSDAWVDGRYVGTHEVIVLGEKFEDHPTADIVVRDVTYTDQSGQIQTQDVVYNYDAEQDLWTAPYFYTGDFWYSSSIVLPEELILTRDEVAALNVDQYSAHLMESGLIYDGTAYPGTAFTQKIVTGVTVPASMEIYMGRRTTVTAAVEPADALETRVTWTSGDPSVVEVYDSGTGVVIGLREGTAVLTATTVDGSYAASCTVTVVADPCAEGHSFGPWTAVTEPTMDMEGLEARVCSVCNETEERTLEKLAEARNPFVDVSESKFYYEPVLWAYYGGITTGKDATHFNPSGFCTRSQVVTFLWRAAGEPEPESLNNPFPDVPEGKFYTKAVLWAVEQGITAGYKDGTFGPNDACTRGQIVTFLWRYFEQPEPQSMDNPFPDVVESKFYYKAVLWAVENEITGGFKDGTFGPNKTCTRDQIVTFLYRAMA